MSRRSSSRLRHTLSSATLIFEPIFTFEEYKRASDRQIERRGYKEIVSYNDMLKDEFDFVTSFDFCPVYPNPTDPKLTNILAHKVHEDAEKEGYNIAVNQAISCLLVKIVNDMTDPEWRRWRTRQLYRDLLKIGAESSFGKVYAASVIGQREKSLVVKTVPRDEMVTLIHEIVVCAGALNNLRAEIPNFAYLYGYFNCTNPASNLTTITNNYCHTGNESLYAVYESISPSISAKELWKRVDLNVAAVLSNFYQVILALQLAHERYDFTHYDLHWQNVLCKKLDSPHYIRYRSAKLGTPINILTDRIAVIIDFGMSHVKIRDKHYGYKDGSLQHVNVFSATSFPGMDCFKYLLLACSELRNSANSDVKKMAIKLINALINIGSENLDDVNRVFLHINDYYFTMPYSEERKRRYGYDYFFNILRNLFPEESRIIVNTEETPSDYPLYGCQGSMVCRTFPDIVSGFLDPDAERKTPDASTLPELLYNFKNGKTSYDENHILKIFRDETRFIRTTLTIIRTNLERYKNSTYFDIQYITVNNNAAIADVARTISDHSIVTEKIVAGFTLRASYGIELINLEPLRKDYEEVTDLVTKFKKRLVDRANYQMKYIVTGNLFDELPSAEILYDMCNM